MAAVLDIALPFFAVILAGYAALRWRFLEPAAVAGLNAFVFWVALPALLVGKLSQAPLEQLFNWRFVVIFYGASVLLGGLILLGSLLLKAPLEIAAMRAYGGVFSNSGYMGIPLLLAALGPEAAIAAVLALLLDNIVTTPVTVALLEMARGGGGWAAARRTLANVVRNPLILGTATGFALALSGLALPTPIDGFLAMLAAATTPCALFALGGSLVGVPMALGRPEIVVLALVRLVLHPLLVWYGAFHLLPLPEPLAAGAVITAALPTAATVFVVAQRYDVFVLRASTLVLLTHLLSVVTLTAALVYFRG